MNDHQKRELEALQNKARREQPAVNIPIPVAMAVGVFEVCIGTLKAGAQWLEMGVKDPATARVLMDVAEQLTKLGGEMIQNAQRRIVVPAIPAAPQPEQQ